ncbi:hypothetical protein MMPV_005923 [Pyropia vietnamensis]
MLPAAARLLSPSSLRRRCGGSGGGGGIGRADRRARLALRASVTPPPSPPSPTAGDEGGRSRGDNVLAALATASATLTDAFPLLTLAAGAAALASPATFITAISPGLTEASLSALMLSMGLTLSMSDIRRGLSRPALLVASVALCYGFMPALAAGISAVVGLSSGHRAGLLLLGLISGGQASNLCVHIAGGDVALSVAMTTASTLGAAVAVPALAAHLLSASVSVGAAGLAATTAKLVLAPVAAGAVANAAAPRAMRALRPLLPVVGIVATLLIILGATARAAGVVAPALSALALPVAALHAGGFVAGWATAKGLAAVGLAGPPGAARRGSGVARTLAFEAGFKSPALAYVLAIKHFAADVGLAPAVSILVLAPLAAAAAALMRRFGAPTPFSESAGAAAAEETK